MTIFLSSPQAFGFLFYPSNRLEEKTNLVVKYEFQTYIFTFILDFFFMKSENITYFAQPKLLGVLKHQKLDRKPFRTSKISKEEFHILFSSSRNPSSFPREKKNPLPRSILHQIRLFWYQSKEQTEETRFQLSKDVGVGEVKVENQEKYWPLFFRGAKWPKPGRSLARPLSREGGGQIWWLGHGCEGETMLDTPIWFLGGFLGLLFRLVPFSFPRGVRRPSFSRNLPHFF